MRLAVEVAPALTDDPSLEWGFLLHDVGKIGDPGSDPAQARLARRRRAEIMQRHTVIGEQLLAHVPLLAGEGLRVVRSHHERWDGDGYPDRLDASDIPLGARIFAVADALDAMTDRRPYRQPLAWEEAIARSARSAGGQFDPDVIDGARRLRARPDRDPPSVPERRAAARSRAAEQLPLVAGPQPV